MDRCSWTVSIPGTPSMVPVARAFVRAFLGDHPLARDAELVVSEYATNAIRHTASGRGGGVMHVTVAASAHAVRIELAGHGPAESEPGPAASRPVAAPAARREAGGDDESGRGLLIVDSLATRWGHYGVAGGQSTAWAVLGEAGKMPPEMMPGGPGALGGFAES